MATHSSTLAWKVPWMEEPGRLQPMGSRRVGHDWVTSLWLFTFMHWEGNGNPLQCSFLETPRDGGVWWAAVYGVTQSRTRLKRLSSSSRICWASCKLRFSASLGKFQLLVLQIFFLIYFSVLSSGTPITCILYCLILSYNSLKFCSLFLIFILIVLHIR